VFLLALLVSLVGCGYQGSTNPGQAPVIQITSYTGEETREGAIDFFNERGEVPFQQIIYWSAWAADGVVVGYAYRILNEDGDPISTPGNIFVDSLGVVTPDVLKNIPDIGTKNGWVIHYEKGASEDFPLDSHEAKRTVWTERVFTVVNFPASKSSDGKIIPSASTFEVVAISNRGAVSNVARKHFYTTSAKTDILVASSKGALATQLPEVGAPYDDRIFKTLGMGIKITFRIDTLKQGIVGTVPVREWYYEYRFYHGTNERTPIMIEGTDTGWHSTISEPKIDEVVLTGWGSPTTPPLVPNAIAGGRRETVTVFQARMIDLAGVESDPVEVRFFVDDSFRPTPLIYVTHSYVLGEHHFVESQDNTNTDVAPSNSTADGIRVSTPFTPSPFINSEGAISGMEWAAVGNELTRFWFRWGYKGEFDINDPNRKVTNEVLDGETGEDYFSEVSYFHIRLNGQQVFYPPLQQPGMQPRPDWLRIPVNHEISQRLSITGSALVPGENILEVNVEDLQGLMADEPARLVFNLKPPKPISERVGVLYIDNNAYTEPQQQEALVAFYEDVMEQADLPFTYIHRTTLLNYIRGGEYDIRQNRHLFPVSFLQDFRYVIYAADSYGANLSTLPFDSDGLRLFMRNGGTAIIVGNQNLGLQANANNPLLIRFFGFPPHTEANPATYRLTTAVGNRFYYFIKGLGQNGYPDVDPYLGVFDEATNTTTHPDWVAGRNISIRRGLPSLTYFRHSAWSTPVGTITPLYLFKCKDVVPHLPPVPNSHWFPVTQAEFDGINNAIVAFRLNPSIPRNGTTYTFGFPWYHMKKESVVEILNSIKRDN
jgi:hypothetical protein